MHRQGGLPFRLQGLVVLACATCCAHVVARTAAPCFTCSASICVQLSKCIECSMSLSKRPKPVPDDVPAAKRLAHNVRDLYASNDISARRTQSLINDMHSANVRHNLAPPMDINNKNLPRSLRKKLLKF